MQEITTMKRDIDVIRLDETDSTNRWLRDHDGDNDLVVTTDYQTAGKGQGTNSWESERGKNLLFSIRWCPVSFPANQQFLISQAVSLAIADTLSLYINKVEVKWPNDIYYDDKKLAGILIENKLHGNWVKHCIIGIGLNVNQRLFLSDAPNPVSLCQVLNHEVNREHLLDQLTTALTDSLRNLSTGQAAQLKDRYHQHLYRKQGLHRYRETASGKEFMATIRGVADDGQLLLCGGDNQIHCYAFKEVEFVIG